MKPAPGQHVPGQETPPDATAGPPELAPAGVVDGRADPVGELVARCIGNDDQAKAQFFTKYGELVERAIARKLALVTGTAPAPSDVEDIRNEVFARLLGNSCTPLRRLKKPGALNAWLMTIAGNHAVDCLRRQARRDRLHASVARESHESYGGSPAEEAMARERYARLADGLAELPAQDRLVLDLFFVQGLKYAEIAEVVGLNINTVSARLRRAKAKLRRLLEEDYDEFA